MKLVYLSLFSFILMTCAPVFAEEKDVPAGPEQKIRHIYDEYKAFYTTAEPDPEEMREWHDRVFAKGFLGTFEVSSDLEPYGRTVQYNKNELLVSNLDEIGNYRNTSMTYNHMQIEKKDDSGGAYLVEYDYTQEGEYYLENYQNMLEDPWVNYTAHTQCEDEIILIEEDYEVLYSNCSTQVDYHKNQTN